MKKIFFAALFLFIAAILHAVSPIYSRVKIQCDENGLVSMLQAGVALDHGVVKPGHFVIAELSSEELAIVASLGLKYEMLIEDMTAYYIKRNEEALISTSLQELLRDYPVPPGFSLGSHGGFYTYDQYLQNLDNLSIMYPGLASPKMPASDSLVSIQNRPLYMIRISNNPSVYQPGKPKILYTGMIHAREAIGMQHLFYFMYYILDKYATDPQIQYLINNAELYFIPMVNPDGYLYNQQTNPNGGGMWRKNRRQNAGGSFGVDLNRNFGYMWGYDNTGSSPTPSSETYRGTGPFSEPETRILKELCQSIPFSIALNYHSYSNLLLYPWGYIAQPTPDDAIFEAFAMRMTADNKYTYGIGSTTIYITNGSSDDWMYGEQFTKNKIFAYTPEVGSSSDGFWPPVTRIIPLCKENMLQSLLAGFFSLHYADLKPGGNVIISQTQGYLPFNLQRLGLQENGTFTVSLTPASPWVMSTGNSLQFSNLGLLQTVTDSIPFTLIPTIPYGTPVKFILSLNNGYYTKSDTITRIFGIPQVIYYDDCSNLNNWIGTWGITTSSYVSYPSCITDSPSGNYSSYSNKSVTTSNFISLENAVFAKLSFWAKWNIEAGWDYVQVRVSTNGNVWIPLAGKYTKPGSSNQLPGQPLYDGVQAQWVFEEIDLSAYIGQNIKIRFTLVSDGAVNADGFYFDDLTVTIVQYAEQFAANFTCNQNVILEGDQVQFFDASTGNIQTWSWEFPGGYPSASSLQNPLVQYSNPGSYDVSLTISNSINSNTFSVQDYILVLDSVLCRPVVFAGNDTIIPITLPYTIVNATAENYSALLWSTSGDGTFDNPTILNPVYTPGSIDIANKNVILTLTAFAVHDVCDNASDSFTLSLADPAGIRGTSHEAVIIRPNPAKGIVHVDWLGTEPIEYLRILDLTGKTVHVSKTVQPNRATLDLSNIGSGLYFLQVLTASGTHTVKVVLSK